MKFKDIDEDHEGSWQDNELKKLNARLIELSDENADLKKKLEKKNYERVYKENQILNLELKNMYILQEENKDLRDDLQRLQKLSYEDKVKEMAAENQ